MSAEGITYHNNNFYVTDGTAGKVYRIDKQGSKQSLPNTLSLQGALQVKHGQRNKGDQA